MPHWLGNTATFEKVNIRSKGFCALAKADADQICFLRFKAEKLGEWGF